MQKSILTPAGVTAPVFPIAVARQMGRSRLDESYVIPWNHPVYNPREIALLTADNSREPLLQLPGRELESES